ncbi:MAG: Tad domain-containing protein, partial [Actinobacteria bacterium]|nr:Tad domain-containing protein [Actinomycetota bacterium]
MVALFGVVLPLILVLGVISVDVGNWWVHDKRAQTLVDAAVFAGGTAFTGCGLDAPAANLRIARRALEYGGDTGRASALVPPITTRNLQEQEPNDLKIVLNSTSYWNGSYPADNTMGTPCDMRYLDAKATDDDAPLLFGFIPFVADPHAHARVEIRQTQIPKGILPFAVPEVDPVRVAVLVVNEDISETNPNSVVGKGFLNKQSRFPGDPLASFNVWRADVAGVNVNGNENFGVVVLTSRNPNVSLTGSLRTICNQDTVQTTCYAGGTSTSGLSFIHSYTNSGSGSAANPRIRQVELAGGCGQSGPYFNLDDDVSCNAILIQAVLDFGVSGDPTGFPTCARVTATPGGAMTWGAGGVGGQLGTWTASFVPAIQSGRREVNLTTQYKKPSASDCSQLNNGPSFGRVAAPYVADEDGSVVVKH